MTDQINRRKFSAMGLAGGAALLTTRTRAESEQLPTQVNRKMRVTILLYPGTTMLDWIGPYEALHWVPDVEIILAAKTTDLMTSDTGIVAYKANIPLHRINHTDVLLVPGGAEGLMEAANDPFLSNWVQRIDKTTMYTIGICTGALLLARIGLLKGKRATTYWKFTDMLAGGGATFEAARWVKDGKYWTSAGVSAGIDLTLALIADLYGKKRAMMAQLGIEYDPHPPFDAGSARTAPKDIIDALGAPPRTQP